MLRISAMICTLGVNRVLIVLLNAVLSIMPMPQALRQIIYGVVIIGMLLL